MPQLHQPQAEKLPSVPSPPNTGSRAAYGSAVTTVVDLAVEEINANGGINESQVKVVKADDQFDPTEAKHVLKEDKRRAEYYRYYIGNDWRDASHFEISLDSSELGENGCVETMIKALPIFIR